MHDAALQRQHERDQRQRRQQRCRRDLAPRHRVLTGKQRNADRQRLLGRVREHQQREEELVPGMNEHEDRGREQAGSRQRQNHAA